MKNCIWLKPELVAQIEFTEWTPDGHLRHSRLLGCKRTKSHMESLGLEAKQNGVRFRK
jgi:bifunctional non-homologous end joining protein LigD